MVWRVPDEVERGRQARWRAGFVWGVFGLLLAAAVGAQTFIPRALEVELGPRLQDGPLSVQMPAGWQVQDAARLTIVAEQGPRRLIVNVVPADGQGALLRTLAAGFENELDEADLERAARPRTINGHHALIVTLNGVKRAGGREIEVHVVRLAWAPHAGIVAVVSLEDEGSRNKGADLLVQQVARTLQLERQDQL